MYISIEDLARRYGIDNDQAIAFLKENFMTINADHDYVSFSKGKWTIDQKAINVCDGILGFTEAEEEPETPKEDPELLELRKEVTSLQNQLERGRKAHTKLQDDYDSLQNKFLQFQEGKEAVNSAMLRKYQVATEQAKKEAEVLKKRLATLQEAKETQYRELTARIEEVTSQLSEQHDLLEKQMRAQSAVLTARKAEDRLYKELQSAQQKSSTLSDSLEQAKLEKEDVLHQMDAIHMQVGQVMKILASAQSQLALCTKPATDVKEVTMKEEPKTALPKKEPVKKIAAKKEEVKKDTVKKGLSVSDLKEAKTKEKTVFHRVASYFGFM